MRDGTFYREARSVGATLPRTYTARGMDRAKRIETTLAMLTPDDLWPCWRYIDTLEKAREITAEEAERWKTAIYDRMIRWELNADDLVEPGS